MRFRYVSQGKSTQPDQASLSRSLISTPDAGSPDDVHQVVRPAAAEKTASCQHRGHRDEAVRIRGKHLNGVQHAMVAVSSEHVQLVPVGDRPVEVPRMDQFHTRGGLRVRDRIVYFDPIGHPRTVTIPASDHPDLVLVLDGKRVSRMFGARISPNFAFRVKKSALDWVAYTEKQYLFFDLAGSFKY